MRGLELPSGLALGHGNVEIRLLPADSAREIRRFLEANPTEAIPPDLLRYRAVREIVAKNRMVKSGRIQHRDNLLLVGPPSSGYTPGYVAVGTGSSAVIDSDTILGTEVFRKAVTRRLAGETTGDPEAVYQVFIDTGEANGNTLREAGLFTFAIGGLLWARVIFAAITKTGASAVTLNWRLPIKAA